jgi:hypothetical protein
MRFPLPCSRLLAAAAALAWKPGFALDLSPLDTAEVEPESLVAVWRTEWKQKPDPANVREVAVSLQALGMVERQAGKPDETLAHLASAWLFFTLLVTQSATIQDLIGDDAFCAKFGINAGVSGSTRRRVPSELVEAALEKLSDNLIN